MRVLPLGKTTDINIVPRSFGVTSTYDFTLVNENTRFSTTERFVIEESAIIANMGQIQIPISVDAKEGDEYAYKLFDTSDNILHRGKIYFTNE